MINIIKLNNIVNIVKYKKANNIKKEIDKVNDILSADYMPRAKWPGKG